MTVGYTAVESAQHISTFFNQILVARRRAHFYIYVKKKGIGSSFAGLHSFG